ncbi:MAG: 1-(5-phosphoribosyl)-5-[(5-phosphoribosylamino)methylideneamino]imidazole-4-carboxamide isomerase [Myxococcales bacterium]|nr:1-(5-phosphoribosyl)-5-[(5-phosphoribosylamino)methylideneamino]imidazole-4-carboxamide isomerase [Myxococcales bacterium]
MELIPAIDILDGQVVRLHQGRYDEVTTYGDDPAKVASELEAAGARRLHVVDLDGARDGRPGNVAAIEAILRQTRLSVQVGGGVRDRAAALRWLDAGAARVVMGTAAIKAPDMTRALAAERPGAVVVAVDARDGAVAVEGWLEDTCRAAVDVAKRAASWGVAALLYTNIARDGTRAGPDVEGTASLQAEVDVPVIASGGVGSLDHLRALDAAGIRAAVCGRALYSGAFTLAEAFEAAGAP